MGLTGWEFALWGAAGSFAVAGLEIVADIKRSGRLPWGKNGPTQTVAFFVAFVLRLAIGAIVASGAGLGGAVSGFFGALGAGIAAPLIIEKIGQSYKSLAIDHPSEEDASHEVNRDATPGVNKEKTDSIDRPDSATGEESE